MMQTNGKILVPNQNGREQTNWQGCCSNVFLNDVEQVPTGTTDNKSSNHYNKIDVTLKCKRHLFASLLKIPLMHFFQLLLPNTKVIRVSRDRCFQKFRELLRNSCL